ncbi:bile acid:sodium symporter family protein [Reyranella sp.]|uniref:bile acid:sodium symporter family protein n=1 Tax=Reyranella sp. TaxID=1929291 RepID=UPI003BAB2B12
MDAQHVILLALKVAIVGTVFGYGLKASARDFIDLARRPGLMLRSILAVLVILPVIVVVLVKLLDLRTATEAVLVALAISPVPPLLPRKLTKAGGLPSYALGLMIVLALVAVVAIPLAVEILAHVFDRSLSVSAGTIARIVFVMIVVPLAAGMAVRAFLPRAAVVLEKPVRWLSTLLLAVAALLLLAGSVGAVRQALGGGTAIALVAFVAIGLAVGHVLGGPEPEHATVLALSTASRHPAIALAIAAVNFPNEQFVGIIVLYLLLSAVVCLPYLAWQRRRSGPADAG